MFRSKLSVSRQNPLKNAERRRLRAQLAAAWPGAAEEELDQLFPPKKEEFCMTKLSNKAVCYGASAGAPTFVDARGHGDRRDFLPTVHGFTVVPSALPRLTVHPHVSKFLIGGADLMFPGVRESVAELPPFASGDLFAVQVMGNSVPFAVGRALISRDDAERSGKTGKFLQIIHVYADALWSLCVERGASPPNEGFTSVIVGPAESSQKIEDDESYEDESAQENTQEDSANPAEELASLHVDEEQSAAQKQDVSVQEMDELLEHSLYSAIKERVSPDSLPLPSSSLLSQHMMVYSPPNIHMDVKKSSYKKLTKFITAMSKKGVIAVKDQRGELVITAIHPNHKSIADFVPLKIHSSSSQQDSQGASGAGSSSKSSSGDRRKIRVLSLRRLKKSDVSSPIFHNMNTKELYSESQLRDAILHYAEANDLAVKKSADVRVDMHMADLLFSRKKERIPDVISKQDLVQRTIAATTLYTVIECDGQDPHIHAGDFPRIFLSTSTHGKRVSTAIENMTPYFIDPRDLSALLRTRFACSSSILEPSSKKYNGSSVQVQGDVVKAVSSVLVKEFGVPQRAIQCK